MLHPKYKLVETLRYKPIRTASGLGALVKKARKEVQDDKSLYRANHPRDAKKAARYRKQYYRSNKEKCLLAHKRWRLANREKDNFIKAKSKAKRKYREAMKMVYRWTREVKRLRNAILKLTQK